MSTTERHFTLSVVSLIVETITYYLRHTHTWRLLIYAVCCVLTLTHEDCSHMLCAVYSHSHTKTAHICCVLTLTHEDCPHMLCAVYSLSHMKNAHICCVLTLTHAVCSHSHMLCAHTHTCCVLTLTHAVCSHSHMLCPHTHTWRLLTYAVCSHSHMKTAPVLTYAVCFNISRAMEIFAIKCKGMDSCLLLRQGSCLIL